VDRTEDAEGLAEEGVADQSAVADSADGLAGHEVAEANDAVAALGSNVRDDDFVVVEKTATAGWGIGCLRMGDGLAASSGDLALGPLETAYYDDGNRLVNVAAWWGSCRRDRAAAAAGLPNDCLGGSTMM
jgi:hypothetical protein